MSIKFIFIFFSFFCLSASFSQQTGQHIIPDYPEELRQLPSNYKSEYLNDNNYNYSESISKIDRLKQWFIEKLISWFNLQATTNTYLLFKKIKYALYFIVIFIVIFAIYRIVKNKEFRWIFGNKKDSSSILNNFKVEENIKEADFRALIEKAIEENDYRIAIKYYYLQLLKILEQANVIEYDPQKTTHDYQLDLKGSEFLKDFSKAAYYYTYIWYGEFIINKNEFDTASAVYLKLLKQFGYE